MFYSGLMLSHHFPFNNMVVKLAVLLMALFTNVHRSLSTASTSSPTFGSLSQVPGLASLNRNEDQVDEQLYSRQLLVYGKSAQRKMQEAHILVIGSSALAAEIIKNLALAGVGSLSIDSGTESLFKSGTLDSEGPHLTGKMDNLVAYAKSLNPYVKVFEARNSLLSSDLTEDRYALIVLVDANLSIASDLSTRLRSRAAVTTSGSEKIRTYRGAQIVVCGVQGVCGYVMDDFGAHFDVEDADGEIAKETPLKSASMVVMKNKLDEISAGSGPNPRINGNMSSKSTTGVEIELRVSCIDEERLTCGLEDPVDITYKVDGDFLTESAHVTKVINPTTVELRLGILNRLNESREDVIRGLLTSIKNCTSTLKNSKKSFVVTHQSIKDLLSTPIFAPANSCLPKKQDKAISMCLLAAFRAAEDLDDAVLRLKRKTAGVLDTNVTVAGTRKLIRQVFRQSLLKNLRNMGVYDPLKPIKSGGTIGNDTLSSISARFLANLPGRVAWVMDELKSQDNTSTSTRRPPPRVMQCPATVSVIGALASQESIKACSHIHTPLNQMLLFESLDSLLPSSYNDEVSVSSILDGEAVYGRTLAQELANVRLFMVGAGAIGCELLKTLALMGACTTSGPDPTSASGGHGETLLADMDSIERSNLNRQLLFREEHVGQGKAVVASIAIKDINPQFRCRAVPTKVCEETEGVFDADFWDGIDVVLTALDNVNARLYVDKQCVLYRKWLLDSGTLGTKGNTQVVIPFVSESYASSADPPEQAIPMCTLKSFPYQPEHCIGWARAIFDQHFGNSPRMLKSLLSERSEESAKSTLRSLSPEDIAGLHEDLGVILTGARSTESALAAAEVWAEKLFHKLFVTDIENLLKDHPAEEIDEEGLPFWGGSRRRPVTLSFNKFDRDYRAFVASATRLWLNAFTTLRNSSSSSDVIGSNNFTFGSGLQDSFDSDFFLTLSGIPPAQRSTIEEAIQPMEFEKDDLSLGHVDFVAAAANLRCIAYSLRTVSNLEVRQVAGRIVPAVATTTALVSGLVCLELLKICGERLIQRRQARARHISRSFTHLLSEEEKERITTRFRNSFALPMLAASQPVSAEIFTAATTAQDTTPRQGIFARLSKAVKTVGKGSVPVDAGATASATASKNTSIRSFTMWDVLEIPGSVDTLSVEKVAEHLRKFFGVDLESVSWGDLPLFAGYMESVEERFTSPLGALLERAMTSDDDELDSEGFTDDRSTDGGSQDTASDRETLARMYKSAKQRGFVDLEVVCSIATDDGRKRPQEEDVCADSKQDVRLPPVRVHFVAFHPLTTERSDENGRRRGWGHSFRLGDKLNKITKKRK